jgi:hypothetical protein
MVRAAMSTAARAYALIIAAWTSVSQSDAASFNTFAAPLNGDFYITGELTDPIAPITFALTASHSAFPTFDASNGGMTTFAELFVVADISMYNQNNELLARDPQVAIHDSNCTFCPHPAFHSQITFVTFELPVHIVISSSASLFTTSSLNISYSYGLNVTLPEGLIPTPLPGAWSLFAGGLAVISLFGMARGGRRRNAL